MLVIEAATLSRVTESEDAEINDESALVCYFQRRYYSRPFFSRSVQPEADQIMSKVCQVTGKGPATGNNVSHSNIKTKRRFLPNLHWHRFWVESEKRFVRLRVSTKGMRIIDKLGIDVVLADIRSRGEKV